MSSYEVLVVGGGVAGCATALALLRRDLSAVILERATGQRHVGEHLPPNASGLLSKLGLWDAFIADEHLPCPGVRASWGSPGVYEREYIFSPYGDGWNLDRRRFDASLVEAVRTAGGAVFHNAHVGTITAQEHGWSVEAVIAGQPQVLTAAFLVDATGRAAAVARKLGGRQVVHDHLIAVMGWMRAGDGANISDATLLIEAAEDGWWYTTLLPGERLLAAFMTSPPLAAREAGPLARYWADQMARTQHIRRRATGFVLEGDVCVKPASTCACRPVAGERWLAVGDAAIAFDPLSSMGISKALRMGLAAADVIQRYLAGDASALEEYANVADREFNEYLATRRYYYSQEMRWPMHSFWRSRHGEPSQDLATSDALVG